MGPEIDTDDELFSLLDRDTREKMLIRIKMGAAMAQTVLIQPQMLQLPRTEQLISKMNRIMVTSATIHANIVATIPLDDTWLSLDLFGSAFLSRLELIMVMIKRRTIIITKATVATLL